MPTTFPYRIGRWSRFYLALWGVRAGHRQVLIDEDRLVSRFGWFGTDIALADIERWDITGPYHWIRAIGIRHTVFSQDISFCGDATGAVRITSRTSGPSVSCATSARSTWASRNSAAWPRI